MLSSFISPLANNREDDYGGDLENRGRFLRQVCVAVRDEVGDNFPVAVKINSADFQRGGATIEEAVQIAKWLEEDGVDVIEVSGGNMETMAMLGLHAEAIESSTDVSLDESTLSREAYFLEYAERIAETLTRAKLMVTGGFRKRRTMENALQSCGVDLIGLGRPFLYTADPAALILESEVTTLPAFENSGKLISWKHKPMTLFINRKKLMACLAMIAAVNMLRLGDGLEFVDDPSKVESADFFKYVWLHSVSARRLKGPKCMGTVYSEKGTSQSPFRATFSFFYQIWIDSQVML